jgi:cysteine desulfurase
MEQPVIYLDYAATTPLHTRVLAAMRPYWSEVFGNPSSLHSAGRAASDALEQARQTVASILACQPGEIVFTSGGTEGNNLAVRGITLARYQAAGQAHIITTPVEHHATGATIEQLRDLLHVGVTVVPVDGYGRVDPDSISRAIRSDTALISVMYANNEVGTIEPIVAIGQIARARQIPFHTDAVQAAGALPLNVDMLGVDLLTLSAHKFYGPKGVGVLYVRHGTQLVPALTGGSQERGRRPGTVNVAAGVGLAAALTLAEERRPDENIRLGRLRDRLIASVLQSLPDVRLTGHPVERLANSASFVFKGIEGESILLALDMEGICVSTGAACTTGDTEPSFVLTAMGWSPQWARGSVRMTLGLATTDDHIDRVLSVLPDIVVRLRAVSAQLPHTTWAGRPATDRR